MEPANWYTPGVAVYVLLTSVGVGALLGRPLMALTRLARLACAAAASALLTWPLMTPV